MSLVLELPEVVEERLRAKAMAQGTPIEDYTIRLLASMTDPSEDWLDKDYHTECEADTSPEVSLADVRSILSRIPGSMTADFIAERDE